MRRADAARSTEHGRLRDLLYVTPVMPSPTGKGVSMRSFAVLEAFAARYAVTCLVVPLWDPRGAHDVPDELARLAQVVVAAPGIAYVVPRRLLSFPRYRQLAARTSARFGPWPLESIGTSSAAATRQLDGRRFGRVHAFRLCMAPYAAALPGNARSSVDLDDLDGAKLRGIARLPTVDSRLAGALEAEAALSDLLLDHWSRRVDLLLSASERDRDALARTVRTQVVVAPNVVRAPPAATPVPAEPPHRITFVGGLDYAPNRDAATWLVREIAPALARITTYPWQLHLVGQGGPELLAELGSADPRVVAHGVVRDVGPHLERSRAIVVPLRAGGGTRIKILEALAHGRPVVATSIGAEGLDVAGGVHLLIGDTAGAIATRLAELLADDAQAARLAAAGRARVLERYSPEALARALAEA